MFCLPRIGVICICSTCGPEWSFYLAPVSRSSFECSTRRLNEPPCNVPDIFVAEENSRKAQARGRRLWVLLVWPIDLDCMGGARTCGLQIRIVRLSEVESWVWTSKSMDVEMEN